MAQYLPLPDGSFVTIREGETPEQAWSRAVQMYPEAFGSKPKQKEPEGGFTPALKAGVSSLKSDVAALLGRTGAISEEEAEKYRREQEEYRAKTFRPTTEGWTEAPLTKVKELLGGSLPYMVAPVAAGAAGAAAPVAGAGMGLAGLASLAQFTGSNLSRQVEEGKRLGETSLGAAAAAGAGQAALDVLSFKMIPGIRGILGAAGKEVTAQGAEQIAKQALTKTALDYTKATGKAMGAEGLTEAAQQVLERMQAGLNLTDEKARNEYWDSLVGGAVLGGVIAPAGRYVERSDIQAREKQAARQAEREEAARLSTQEAAAAQQEEARRQTLPYFQEVEQKYNDLQAQKKALQDQIVKAPKGEKLSDVDKANNRTVMAQLQELGPEIGKSSREYARIRPMMQQAQEQERLAGMTPEEAFLERMGVPPTKPAEPRLEDFIPQAPEPTAPAPTERSLAEKYARDRVELAREQRIMPAPVDYAEYLTQDPVMARRILQDRISLPGISFDERQLVFQVMRKNLAEQERQALEESKKSLAERVSVTAAQPEKPKVGVRKAPDYEGYLAAQEQLDVQRQEGQTASEIARMERERIPTGATEQLALFPREGLKGTIFTGNKPVEQKSERELLAELQIARVSRNRNAAAEIAEALRTKREKPAEVEKTEFDTAALQQQLGRAAPAAVAAQQQAADARADAYAKLVDTVAKYNQGKAKQDELIATRTTLLDNLIKDVETTRGTPVDATERKLIEREATDLVNDLVTRFGDTRAFTAVPTGRKDYPMYRPAQTTTGEFAKTEVPASGLPTVELAPVGKRTFGNPYAAAMSIKEGLDALRDKAVAAKPSATVERTITQTTATPEMFNRQLAQALERAPEIYNKPERRVDKKGDSYYLPPQRELLALIADNAKIIERRPELRDAATDWMYSVGIGNEREDVARRLDDELRVFDTLDGSGQQLRLPIGALTKEKKVVEFAGPKKPGVGTYSFFTPRIKPEEIQDYIFPSSEEFQQFMASDALQQMRSAAGFGRPTIQRLEARVAPFLKRVDAAEKEIQGLREQYEALEAKRREQLEQLAEMSEQDRERAEKEIKVAGNALQQAKKRFEKLKDDELAGYQLEYLNAATDFEIAVKTSEDLTKAIAANVRDFTGAEDKALANLQAAKDRLRSEEFLKKMGGVGLSFEDLLRSPRAVKQVMQQQQKVVEATRKWRSLYALNQTQTRIVKFLDADLNFQTQLQETLADLDNLATNLLDAGLKLDLVENQFEKAVPQTKALTKAQEKLTKASETYTEAVEKETQRKEEVDRMARDLGAEVERHYDRFQEEERFVTVLRSVTDDERLLAEQIKAAAQVKREPENAAALRELEEFIERRERRQGAPESEVRKAALDKAQARLESRAGVRMTQPLVPVGPVGEIISFEERRKLQETLNALPDKLDELAEIAKDADDSLAIINDKLNAAREMRKKLDDDIERIEKAAESGAPAKRQAAETNLEGLREEREKLIAEIKRLGDETGRLNKVKSDAEQTEKSVRGKMEDLERLFSNDPDIAKAVTQSLDKREAKLLKNIDNVAEKLQIKRQSKAQRAERQKELNRYQKELRELRQKRAARRGIERTFAEPQTQKQLLSDLKTTIDVAVKSERALPEAETPVEGARLPERKIGPAVKKGTLAANIRTGEAATAEDRFTSSRNKITQAGIARGLTSKQAQRQASKDVAAQQALEDMNKYADLREKAEEKLAELQATTVEAPEAQKKIAADIAKYEGYLARIDKAIESARKRRQEALSKTAVTVYREKELKPQKPAKHKLEDFADSKVREQVKALTKDEILTLEEAYEAPVTSKTFLQNVKQDLVNYVNAGARSVALGIRNIIQKLASGMLAVAVFFNPQFNVDYTFNIEKALAQPAVTKTVDIKTAVPEAARGKMSPSAQMVYENMASAAKESGKGFIIADKPAGMIHLFNPDGSVFAQDTALYGADRGDALSRSSLQGGPKITPAGKFTMVRSTSSEYAGGAVFQLPETETEEDPGVIAVHAAYLGNPKENRLGRLKSQRPEDRRISYGCINTDHDLFLKKLLPAADKFDGGFIFVLPDAVEKTPDMFPATQVTYVDRNQNVYGEDSGPGAPARKEQELVAEAPRRVVYSTTKREGAATKYENVQRLVERASKDWANVPNIILARDFESLPEQIKEQARADKVEAVIPGVFDPNTNSAYLVADRMFTPEDVFATLAHEVIGHYGLRSLLGESYTKTMNDIYEGNKEAREKADAKLAESVKLTREVAVEEVLAEMAEAGVTPQNRSALARVFMALKNWFRRTFGLDKVSNEAVEQIVANARRYVIEGGEAGAGVAETTGPVYRTAKPKYEKENALTELADKVVAQPPSLQERLGGNVALQAEMANADMRAAVREVMNAGAKAMGNDKLFAQAMYSVIKSDQRMPLVYTALSNGPLETYTDEKGFVGIRSSNKDSAKDVYDAVSDIPGGNAQAKMAMATVYMIAQRAANKGLSKLDLGELGVTEADLQKAMAAANADPALRSALENVRRKYNAYNAGMIEFLASVGAIPKKLAKDLLKDGDYVPYYRVRGDGNAELVLGAGRTITLGDVRYQPHLQQLKGGETKIIPLNESIPRNTMLLVNKAMTNMAARNIGYALQAIGKDRGPVNEKTGKPTNAMAIHKGDGPAGPSIVRFNQEPDANDPKDDGSRWVRVDTRNTVAEGIPSELLVKSLEGSHLTLPSFLKVGGIAADYLRKGVTRMPPYILRQLIRDPMAASFTGGLDYGPFRAVFKAGKEFIAQNRGDSTNAAKLIEKGLVQSNIFTGDPDDISAFALQLASGKDASALDKLFGMLDRAAMRADASTRALIYENARNNGLSEVEADMMVMESMNFYKRGLAPGVQYASRLLPFLNAQIQGLNVLSKAARGRMPFNEQLSIQRKFYNNALFLFATGVVYAMAMDDDEYYKNAKPRDRYTNFFVPLPGVAEPVKVPLPYEQGWFFSAAVALVDSLKGQVDNKQQFTALRDMFLNSVPGYSSMGMPQIIKPAFEVWTNKNFFSGEAIESAGMRNKVTEERYNAATTEAAKALSKALPVLSPIQIEHLARGYFGVAPLAIMAAASTVIKPEEKGEAPERRLSQTPIIGTMFQTKYGGADASAVYEMAQKAREVSSTFNELKKAGDAKAAQEFVDKYRIELTLAPAARKFVADMAKLKAQEKFITDRENLSAAEKRQRIDRLDEIRQQISNRYYQMLTDAQARFEKTTPR